jgi:SAM-dependent methyltransferase
MTQKGWQATGLEPDKEARTRGKQIYNIELNGIDDFYNLPADHFDAITLWHVLEHVHDLGSYVQQLKNLLKESGKIFIAVPNYTSKDAQIYKEYWAAYDVPRHLYHFSPLAMEALMQKNGLKIETYRPMWYDSIYISLLSNKYKYGHLRLISSFWNGICSNLAALGNVKRCSSVIYIISK